MIIMMVVMVVIMVAIIVAIILVKFNHGGVGGVSQTLSDLNFK